MERPPKRGNRQPRGGRGGSRAKPAAPKAAGERAWAGKNVMGSARSMRDATRQKARQDEGDEYLGPPPQNRDLIQVSL